MQRMPRLAFSAVAAVLLSGPCAHALRLPGLVGVVRFANTTSPTGQLWDGPAGVEVVAEVTVAPGLPSLTWSTTTESGGRFELDGLPPCRDVILRSGSDAWEVERVATARTICPDSAPAPSSPTPTLVISRAPVTGRIRGRTVSGDLAPLAGVTVTILTDGASILHVRTLADGTYSTAGVAPGFPLGSVVTVSVEEGDAAEAGLDSFEHGIAAARFRLAPGPSGPAAASPPRSATAQVMTALSSLLPRSAVAFLPSFAETESRLTAPELVVETYAVCGAIYGEGVRHMHVGGDIPRSVRLFAFAPRFAEAKAEEGGSHCGRGSTFMVSPLGRTEALAAQNASRFLWQKYSAASRQAAGAAGPLNTRGPQAFCFTGLAPGSYAVAPGVLPTEAVGGIRFEPAGLAFSVGPQALAHGTPATHALRFEVVAPSVSGTVLSLEALPVPKQGLQSSGGAEVRVLLQLLDELTSTPRSEPRSVPVLPLSEGSAHGSWHAGGLWPGDYLVAACAWTHAGEGDDGAGSLPWCWAEPAVRGTDKAPTAPASWTFSSAAGAAFGATASCSDAVIVRVAADEGGRSSRPGLDFEQAGYRVFPHAAHGATAIPLRLSPSNGASSKASLDAVARPLSLDPASSSASRSAPAASLLASLQGALSRLAAAVTGTGLVPNEAAPAEGSRVFVAWIGHTACALFDALRDHIVDPASLPAALLHAALGRPTSGIPAPSPALLAVQPDFQAWAHEDPHARRHRILFGDAPRAVSTGPVLPVAQPRAAAAAAAGAQGVCLPTGSYYVEPAVPDLPCLVLAAASAKAAPVQQGSEARAIQWCIGGSGGCSGNDATAADAGAPLKIAGWWTPGAVVLRPAEGAENAPAALCSALAAARVTVEASLGGEAGAVAALGGRLLDLSPLPPALRAELEVACGGALSSSMAASYGAPSGLGIRADYSPALEALRSAAPPARLRLPVRVEAPLGLAVRVAVCGGAPAASSAAGPAAWGGAEAGHQTCPGPLPDAEAGEAC